MRWPRTWWRVVGCRCWMGSTSACGMFSVAGRLSRSGRPVRLRLAEHLLWDAQITAAVICMQAIQPG